ncbi:MAG: fatty acid desaturase [Chthoniobacterales bacterium]
MRTGHALILATKQYAKDSTVKSWWYVLSTGGLFVLALAGTMVGFFPGSRVLCSILSGFLMLRFFVIYHDQQHHAILPRSRVAESLMRIFGILVLSPSSMWRSSHNHHHNHNSKLRGSHIGSFPVMTKQQYLKSSGMDRFKYRFMRHPLTILFSYIFVFLYGMCIDPYLNDPKEHSDCLIALIVHVLIGATLAFFGGWETLILTQTLPHFIADAIGAYLFYAQHNFPTVSYNSNAGWTYEKAAMESSSYLKTGPIMGWFTANIGYHHIHHLNAKIPFYRLPEVMREMTELQKVQITSLNPIEIFRCLRLKVWDVELQRMVSLPILKKAAAAAPIL